MLPRNGEPPAIIDDKPWLAGVVGGAAADAVLSCCEMLGAHPQTRVRPRIVLRRRQAVLGERLHFHRDRASVTVNIALNSQADFKGGRLMFLVNGAVHCPTRAVGSAIINDGYIVHGVSEVNQGARYSLFAFVDCDDGTGTCHGFPFVAIADA